MHKQDKLDTFLKFLDYKDGALYKLNKSFLKKSQAFYLLIGPNDIVLVATNKVRLMTNSLEGNFTTYPGPNIPDVSKTFHNINSLKSINHTYSTPPGPFNV